jgi:hypothetical protein
MREIGKFCRIYCHEAHKKWPELLPHIERWLNGTISDSTGYSPIELMCGEDRPDLLKEILKKAPENTSPIETLQNKIVKAYVRMTERAAKGNKRKTSVTKWDGKLGDLVLAKYQPVSDAAVGVTRKFSRSYDGPWEVVRIVAPSTYEVTDVREKILKVLNKTALKPYVTSEG